jgi:hypothetical protein
MKNDSSTSTIAALRSRLSTRRAARRAHRELRADLATYNRPGDRLELLTIMERYSSKETAPIRAILTEQSINS